MEGNMKEYVVLTIEGKKGLKAFEIYTKIKEHLNFHRTFFEFLKLFGNDSTNTKKLQQIEMLGLQKFYHIKI